MNKKDKAIGPPKRIIIFRLIAFGIKTNH